MRLQFLLAASLVAAAPATAQTGGQSAAVPYTDSSLQCLTQAVYYEARNQSTDGQRAVAQVVLNRTRDPAYPRSVCGVVFQGSERYTGCQFSFTCDGSMNAWIEPYAWERAQAIAAAALSGSVYRPVGSATHYHTTAISPYWAPSLVQQAVIGSHVFYRRPGGSAATPYQGRVEQVRVEEIPEESWSVPAVRAGSGASGARRSRPRLANLEIPVMEIPVLERPVRVRAQRAAATRAAPSRRAAPERSGPSTRVESGVRVTRG